MIEKFLKFTAISSVMFLVACGDSTKGHEIKNPIVENNIQSYEVIQVVVESSGMEVGGQVLKRVEFDKQGNILKEVSVDINFTTVNTYNDSLLLQSVMTNADGDVIHTMKMEYKDNQYIERNFDENNNPTRVRTLYKDNEGRDTLSIYVSTDGYELYKIQSKYDNIGLKESVMYAGSDTTYTKRINDDKLKHVFESARSNGVLVYRETKMFDNNGNQIEFLYEGLMDPGSKDISHHKTTYLDNGLVDNVLFLDEDGNGVRRELYEYMKFQK